jgi:hypothetical protein
MRTTYKVSPFDSDGALVRAPAETFNNPRELLSLPARLVPDLPLAFTLSLAVEGAPARLQLTTELHLDAGDSLAEVIVFDREEMRSLFIAVEADRVWRKDLLGVCFDKWRKPEHRLTLERVLAGANPDEQERDWTLGRVLARLGATVESIELADQAHETHVATEATNASGSRRLSRAA